MVATIVWQKNGVPLIAYQPQGDWKSSYFNETHKILLDIPRFV